MLQSETNQFPACLFEISEGRKSRMLLDAKNKRLFDMMLRMNYAVQVIKAENSFVTNLFYKMFDEKTLRIICKWKVL